MHFQFIFNFNKIKYALAQLLINNKGCKGDPVDRFCLSHNMTGTLIENTINNNSVLVTRAGKYNLSMIL